MNILSAMAGPIKAATSLADGLGMCKGCHIRKRGLTTECQSCGADLCAKCLLDTVEHHDRHNEMMRQANRPPTKTLLCEACGKKWGDEF